MQRSSEQPLVGEEHYVTTLITAAKETNEAFDGLTLRCHSDKICLFFFSEFTGPRLQAHLTNKKKVGQQSLASNQSSTTSR